MSLIGNLGKVLGGGNLVDRLRAAGAALITDPNPEPQDLREAGLVTTPENILGARLLELAPHVQQDQLLRLYGPLVQVEERHRAERDPDLVRAFTAVRGLENALAQVKFYTVTRPDSALADSWRRQVEEKLLAAVPSLQRWWAIHSHGNRTYDGPPPGVRVGD